MNMRGVLLDVWRREWRGAAEGGEGEDGWGGDDCGEGRHIVWGVWGVDGWANKAADDRSGWQVRKGALVVMGSSL